ncbi:MAG: hypothetical protein HFH26_07840 [Clostridiaceae bacterium]|nr:hypothetical protein [Clostridiaceae bacterium]
MKKLVSFLAVFGLIFSMTGLCFASGPVIESQTVSVETLEDGTTVETIFTIYKNFSRSRDIDASITKNYSGPSSEKAASVTLYASFGYNGNDVWCDSAYSDVSVYNSWRYGSEDINDTSDTARLSARLTKSGENSKSISIYIKCSPSGKITHN